MVLQDRIPNEAACPVDLTVLALLMRSTDDRRPGLIANLQAKERIALALFCYNRAHLRGLAFDILRNCNETEIHRFAGPNGGHLYLQANDGPQLEETHIAVRRPISLAGRIAC